MGKIICGDAVEEMLKLADNSIDSIVTDPPYELGFMGKHWDKSGIAYNVEMWRECLRVLKPGGHLLSFGGSRTYHRMACAIEDAGFEIRDQIMWIYGSGFPKSLDVSKAIDRAAGAEREVVGKYYVPVDSDAGNAGKILRSVNAQSVFGCTAPHDGRSITAPTTEQAQTWQGWGTAFKPAHEPICVARKPLSEKTVAENVLKWGTGAINVDGGRIGLRLENESGWSKTGSKESENRAMSGKNYERLPKDEIGKGRWPSNIIHDGSDEVVGLMPKTTSGSGHIRIAGNKIQPGGWRETNRKDAYWQGDSGSAARFFYCAKASRAEREMGLEGMEVKHVTCRPLSDDENDRTIQERLHGRKARNHHPTVKPLALMRYLVRLVTPSKGLVLDPFMGSGTTGMACMAEGFEFIGIDNNPEYIEIAKKRIYGELSIP